ncbi:MAG TPA: 2-amino-4-oxopentanoate thiolase subunit OrtA [Verrucomicrobiae bacterium]|nr:2-amino-4-oxopentanoate thiolase subunit OrtA [Verrucomicrobiae bacterium]
MIAKRGDWVQIYRVILPADERAPQVPQDTKQVPLELWVKGFLQQDQAKLGEEVEIITTTGRAVQGELNDILPRYNHDFGSPQPELLKIGTELRRILWGGEKNG